MADENMLLKPVAWKYEATQSGVWRKFLSADGKLYREFTSHREMWGLPLVHKVFGVNPETGQTGVAHGVIAIGTKARGVIACGQFARGHVAIGQFVFGDVAIGQFALGRVFAVGQFALAPAAIGTLGIGMAAIGFGVLGWWVIGAGGVAVENILGVPGVFELNQLF